MIKIEDFCAGADHYREHLCRPHVYYGKLYASNGHIAVCVPAPQCLPGTQDSFGEKLKNIFESANFDAGMGPLPDYPSVELPKCEACGGLGKYKPLKECPECRGEGFVEWDTDLHTYDADCKECNGDGEVGVVGSADVTCRRCSGSGTEQDVPVRFGGTAINYRYLKLMETLPGLLVGLAESQYPNVIPFKFDGGVGLVMPIRPIKKAEEFMPSTATSTRNVMNEETKPLPDIKMCACESSQISEYGYDEPTKTLAIKFKHGGSVYHYDNVGTEVYADLCAAESKGAFFGKRIKHGGFNFTKIVPVKIDGAAPESLTTPTIQPVG